MQALALAIGGAALATPVWAQTEDSSDEIIVTAQRREEAVLDVPIAVRSIGADELARNGVDDVLDIVSLAPSLRIDYRLSMVQPSIRGVGSIISVPGTGNNVAVYQDGFYMQSPLETDFALLNVDSIQVLKGPQGTLFGRNSTGGAILLQTSAPDTETRTEVRVRGSNYAGRQGQAYFTTGLGGGIAADVAAFYSAGDGTWDNIATGEDDWAEYEKYAVRFGLGADITSNLSVNFHYTWADLDDNGVTLNGAYRFDNGGPALLRAPYINPAALYGTEPNQFANVRTSRGEVPRSQARSEAYQLAIDWDLGFATADLYSQYRRIDRNSWLDTDLSTLHLFFSNTFNTEAAWSHELILTSNPGSPLQWTAGYFYFNNDVRYDPVGRAGDGALLAVQTSGFEVTSNAVFVDLTYQLTDNLYLTGGVRYSQDEVNDAEYIAGPLSGLVATRFYPDIDDSATTPRLVLRYEPDDVSSIYVSYSQGYKAAIANIGGAVDAPIHPEEMTAYEIGYKRHTNRYSLELAAYRYDYTNLQLSSANASNSVTLRNASDVEATGLELDFRLNLTDNFEVYFNGSWVKAEYVNFATSAIWNQCTPAGIATLNGRFVQTATPCPVGINPGQFFQTQFDATGLQVIRTPELTATIGAAYTFPDVLGGEFEMSGNLYHSSENYYDLADQFAAPSYNLLTLRAEWRDPSDRFSVALFGENVLDEEYITLINATGFGIGTTWGRRAMFGIELGAEF
jgi:iron complex outermembrane receptor protein